MKFGFISVAGAAFTAVMATGGAQAATLDFEKFDKEDFAAAGSYRAGADTDFEVALETFETFTPVASAGGSGGGTGDGDKTPLDTAVGTFTTVSGANCGGSCDAPSDQSLIRNTSSFGRYNTTVDGANWLDSNDNRQVSLDIMNIGLFDSISLFLTDLDDVGTTVFTVSTGQDEFSIGATQLGGADQPNGALFFLRIQFESLMSSAMLNLSIDSGDGFGIDDVRIGSSVSPVPVPGSLPLLLVGVGALGWGARRRKVA